jgi:hypothetical protein
MVLRSCTRLAKTPLSPLNSKSYDGNVRSHCQAMVIGRIDAQLKAPQQVSKAAPPGSPVGTRSGAQTKDVKSMSIDEYYASITTRKGKK